MHLDGIYIFFILLSVFVAVGELVMSIYGSKNYKPGFWEVIRGVCLFSNVIFIFLAFLDVGDVEDMNTLLNSSNDYIQIIIPIILLMVYLGTPIVLVRDFIIKNKKTYNAQHDFKYTWFLLVEFALSMMLVYLLISANKF
jgi:hypothetical protein